MFRFTKILARNTKCISIFTAAKESSFVIAESINNIGIIRFNRPKQLNIINLGMIQKILLTLKEWEEKKAMVIFSSNGGKAFSAGGDIVEGLNSINSGSDECTSFVKQRTKLLYLMSTFKIPIIMLSDGITFGSGLGLYFQGHFRVATEKSSMQAPEISIGCFPDVGMSYYLPRLENNLGIFLGLTCYILKGGDTFKAGITSHMCQSSQLNELENDLISSNTGDLKILSQILQKYHEYSPESRKPFSLESQIPAINKIFNNETIEEIISHLKTDSSEFSKGILKILLSSSPSALKVGAKVLQMAKNMSYKDCLHLEYGATTHIIRNHDFFEGVRAKLIDKDNMPKWKPPLLENVTKDIVDGYFIKVPGQDELFL